MKEARESFSLPEERVVFVLSYDWIWKVCTRDRDSLRWNEPSKTEKKSVF